MEKVWRFTLLMVLFFLYLLSTSVLHAEDMNNITYTYDENNRLMEKRIVANDGVHYQMKYDYDPNGNLLNRRYGKRNFLKNGDFEAEAMDPWTVWIPQGATGSAELVQTTVQSGIQSLKLTASGIPQWQSALLTQTSQVDTKQQSYVYSGFLNIEQLSGAMVTISVRYLDVNNQYISQQTKNFYSTNGYVPFDLKGMTPANVRYIQTEVHIKASQSVGGGTVYVDALKFEYAASNVPMPANVSLLAKTDKTADVTWDAVTEAVVYEIYKGATKVGTSSGTSYTVAGLSPSTTYDITIRAKDVEGYVSLPSPALSVTTEVAGTNLLTNGGFDTVTGDAGWTLWLPPTAAGELVVVDTPVDLGTHAFKLTAGGLAQWDIAFIKQTVNVDPNMSFKLKAALRIEQKTYASVVYRVLFRDANGQYIAHQQSDHYLITAEYIPLEIIGMTPVGAVTADVEVQVKASQAGGGGTAYVDSLSLEYAAANVPTPANLSLLSKTDKTADVTWDAVTEAVAYEIYKGATKVGTSSGTSYTVAGLSPDTTYDITIRAKDVEGFVSLPSPALSVTTEAAGANLLTNGGFDTVTGDAGWTLWLPPTAAGELVVVDTPVDLGTHAFKLTAGGLAQWETAYIRQTVNIDGNELFKLRSSLTIQQMNSALVTFKIVFRDSTGQYILQKVVDKYYATSGYVPLEIVGMTPVNAVTADVEVQVKANQAGGGGTAYVDSLSLEYEWSPKNLSVSGKTDSTIDLSWQAPTNDSVVSEYEIYQDGNWIATSAATQLTVTGLNPTTKYLFTVKAKHVDGHLSIASNELKVATKPLPGYYSIMPLGASITDGYNVPGGYRIELWNKLVSDGFFIDFVGSQSNGPGSLPDQNHEGHPGWRIDQIYDQLDEWLIYEPQMVVIHLGTNDMFDNGQASTAGQDLQQLIDKITTQLPNTQVVVSSIVMLPINNFERNPYVLGYNAQIPGIVDAFRAQGRLVTYVDMYPAIGIDDFDTDLIHPTSAGYDKMAVVWHDAIHAILTANDKNPTKPGDVQLVSSDGISAVFAWSASSDNIGVTSYDIYQDGVWYAATDNTQYMATNLPANSTLSYTIVARDAAGNDVAAQFPCQETSGFFLPMLTVVRDNEWRVQPEAVPPFIVQGAAEVK